MSYKIVEWNINNASRAQKIPGFVGDEILNLHADLIILTEFVYCAESDSFLKEFFTGHGYDYRVTQHDCAKKRQNDIVVAWDRKKFSCRLFFEMEENTDESNPKFLADRLQAKADKKDFVLAGCRITIGSERSRFAQMKSILEALSGIPSEIPVVIAGDFNNFRRGYVSKTWSLKALDTICARYQFVKYTPTGSSIYQESSFSENYEFPEYHFITKDCEISEYRYDRSFTCNNLGKYLYGPEFRVYNRILRCNTWQISCGSGIPDHAMLVGTLSLQSKTGKADLNPNDYG